MRTFLTFMTIGVLGLINVALPATPFNVQASSFSKNDHIIILVSGFTNQNRQFGYSGKASTFRSTGTTSTGKLRFSVVPGADNIDVERNSATDPDNKNNYGTNGYIPPGIYFLHYHRLDVGTGGTTNSNAPCHNTGRIRHRLGLSDRPCTESIRVTMGDSTVSREALQFHVAYNDLTCYRANVSEGCITLTNANFLKLFPESFFEVANSPLNSCQNLPNHTNAYTGDGRILVFVTDATNTNTQNAQIQTFNDIVRGGDSGLMATDFSLSANSALPTLRTRWKAGIP